MSSACWADCRDCTCWIRAARAAALPARYGITREVLLVSADAAFSASPALNVAPVYRTANGNFLDCPYNEEARDFGCATYRPQCSTARLNTAKRNWISESYSVCEHGKASKNSVNGSRSSTSHRRQGMRTMALKALHRRARSLCNAG